MNDCHLPFQESCIAGFYPCFQSRLRTCFAITYFYFLENCETPPTLLSQVSQLSISTFKHLSLIYFHTLILNSVHTKKEAGRCHMFITTACFFFFQNTQVHKSYENKTVFIHTAHTTAAHLFFVLYNRICFHMIFSLLYFLSF